MEIDKSGEMANLNTDICKSTGSTAMDVLTDVADGAQASETPSLADNKASENLLHGGKMKKAVPSCKICSNKEVFGYKSKTGKIRHKHFSSKRYAERIMKKKGTRTYPCLTCKKNHGEDRNAKRLKICVTSSTLSEYWRSETARFFGDDFHIHWICIPGATVNQLSTAWEIEYGEETRPMDVLLVGGLVNVIRGTPGPTIVSAFQHFINLVNWQGESHPDEPNTCAVGTLVYPPSLCWLEDDGPAPPTFDNQLRNMRWLNKQIENLNYEAGIKVPNFPTFGVRKVTKNGRGITKHRMEHWRENERSEMLHLRDDQRIKMAKQVARYFQHNTSW